MGQAVTVVATQDFTHEGRPVHVGEAVTMRPIDAAVAGRLGRVSLDKSARATYQTKDLVAVPVAPTPVPSPAPSATTTAKRRAPRRSRARRAAAAA